MSFPDRDRILEVIDKINKGRIKATEVLDEEAPPVDQMKFNICQQMIKFKRTHGYSNKDLSEIIGVGPAVISRILHCQINRFKVDSLLQYYSALIVSSKNKKLQKEFNERLAGFLKDLAA
ncbi:MAG: hypothetical protein CL678_09205 [Bdellovibrionaceae bacterium]|nr:hypothetical protein [Pseudobdellovibrionaceae bacterium]|tara:strand:+ start:553 stop:912 length:360 start_codon:yes stop_codon:yes gene_type:complete